MMPMNKLLYTLPLGKDTGTLQISCCLREPLLTNLTEEEEPP